MVPRAAAKAEPERPATMMAASSTPSSRRMELATRSTMRMLAPNCSNWRAPWYASTMPIRKLITQTMGMAAAPVAWTWRMVSPITRRDGRRIPSSTARAMKPTESTASIVLRPILRMLSRK